MDHPGRLSATEKDTVSAQIYWIPKQPQPRPVCQPAALPTQDTFQGGPSRTLGISGPIVLSPTKVNEFALRRSRSTSLSVRCPRLQFKSSGACPEHYVVRCWTGTTFGGLDPTFLRAEAHDTYEYQDAFSWAVGNHSFKMGADLIHLR